MTLDELLEIDDVNAALQEKFDRRGQEIKPEDTNTRLGSYLQNLVEDLIKALWQRTDTLVSGSAVQIFDTRTTGSTNTGSIAAGGSGEFEIEMPTERVSVQWLRVRANSGESGPGGRIRFYSDSARTKLVYDSDMKLGDPPVDVDDFVDGMAWGAFDEDGGGLELDEDDVPHIYGTVNNGGSGPSTFTVRLVAICY